MNKKGWRKFVLAVILVAAVSTTLWFAAPVSALEISITGPSSAYLGSDIEFDITIDVEAGELLPIKSVNLLLYETAIPGNSATYANLPLSDGELKEYDSSHPDFSGIPEFGELAVTAHNPLTGGYGYGYVEWDGTPYNFGYGYGYGTGSLTYDMTWTPGDLDTTTYTAEISVIAVDDTTFSTTTDVTLKRRSGGGGGGGGPDKSGPRLSKHALCGIAMTTADICWNTHERSTSQVQFGTASGTYDTLSELDETLVYEHRVTLTGLTPGTTYYYQEMSADKAENLSVSEEMSFTTTGVPATFSVTSLAIDPAEADIGQAVVVNVTVANTGDGAGKYQAKLMVDGAVVATKEVTIAGHTDMTITFSLTQDAAGTYSVSIDGQSVSLVIKEAPAPPPVTPPVTPPEEPTPTPSPINWWLIGGIIVAVMIAATVIWLTVIRQRA
jgi:opacity protein-like surface antigen